MIPDLKGALETSTGQLRINCIFCEKNGKTPDEKHHLYISKTNFKFKCHRCGESGNFKEHFPHLDYYIGLDDFVLDFAKFDSSTGKITFKLDEMSEPLEPWHREHLYCESRKLTFEEIKYYRIRRGHGHFYNYIIIPEYDSSDDCVYFIARSVEKNPYIRYNNPSAQRISVLMNWHRARHYYSVYLTEGWFTGKALGPNFVAQLGTIISDVQAKKIAALPKVEYCPDGDVKIEEIERNFKTILKYRDKAFYIPMPRKNGKWDADNVPPSYVEYAKANSYLVDGFTINDLGTYIHKLDW